MPKPSEVPLWATDGTNNTPPSTSQRATGWTRGQDGVSSYDNWYKALNGMWLAFLDALFGADGSLSLPTDASVKLTGTGRYSRGTRIRKFSATSGQSYSTGTFPRIGGVPTGAWQALRSEDILDIPIVVEQYERIIEFSVRVFGDTGCMLHCTLFKQETMFAVSGPLSLDGLSEAHNTDQTITVNQNNLATTLAEEVDDSAMCYFVRVRARGTPAGSGPFVGVVTVKTTVPPA
jgi:hypothetical protein